MLHLSTKFVVMKIKLHARHKHRSHDHTAHKAPVVHLSPSVGYVTARRRRGEHRLMRGASLSLALFE